MTVAIQDYRLIDEFCNFMLRALATKKTHLSKDLTRYAGQAQFKTYTPLQKKLLKLRELHKRDRVFFEETVAQLNRSEYKGSGSPLNFIQIAERMLPELHYRGEVSGGNFKEL